MDGINIVKWKNREGMFKRGVRMMIAYHRGFVAEEGLAVWFQRNLSRYASHAWSRTGKPTDIQKLEARFWSDANKHVITKYYGYQLEEYS